MTTKTTATATATAAAAAAAQRAQELNKAFARDYFP